MSIRTLLQTRLPHLSRTADDAEQVPAGLPSPEVIEVAPKALTVGPSMRSTFAASGYPREVGPGWLEPVLSHPGPVDLALHIEPIPSEVAARRLRRQIARLESSRQLEAARGRLADPSLDASAYDAMDLQERLARGEGRLFTTGLYATVRGGDVEDLNAQASRLRAVAGAMLLETVPTTFRQLPGWLTTLPLGLDLLRMRRTMDTDALAAGFPFTSPDLPDSTTGVLYGLNSRSRGLLLWDRFAQPNYNLCVLARSGAGKSYLAKLDALRWLYTGVDVLVVDPENEYGGLAEAVGGTALRLGAPGVRLNPLDLAVADGPEAPLRRALFVHTLVSVLLGQPLVPDAGAALDRAISRAYQAKGITADPRTHRRAAPLLLDVVAELSSDDHPAAHELAGQLQPHVSGAHRGLWDGPTTTRPEGHLVVFSLRDLPDETKTAGTLLALDAIWRTVSDPAQRRRRIVVVDEAWLLMRDPAGAGFLARLAKSARKYWAGLTVVTQDAVDLLGNDLGLAVVSNAATQVLLRQAPQAVDALAAAFRLSDGECTYLLGAERGQGLLAGAGERVAFQSLASAGEHRLCSTDPAELAEEVPA